MRRVSFSVNGAQHELDLEPRELLVYVLRDRLRLTGTNVGCDTSSCGACTIMVDGELHPVQQAFHEQHALQCGFCTPGMVMSVIGLLDENSSPSEEEIRKALEGNLCRCTGYQNIVKAVQAVGA